MLARLTRLLATGALALAFFAPSSAWAQKPPATPLPPPPPPPSVDVKAWRAAYESANRPSIMIVVGWSTEQATAPAGATEAGALVLNADPGGFAESFRLAISEHIAPPAADVELVDDAALAAAKQRLNANLSIRRENEAIALLAATSKADIVVLVRLYGDPKGTPTRVNMSVANSRGRQLVAFQSGWNVGADPASVNLMGQVFAAEVATRLSERFANPQRYTAHVFGLADAEAAFSLTQCLQDGRGVSKVRSNRAGGGGRDAFREYEITTSLEQDMLEVFIGRCAGPMNLVAETVSMEGGVVNIRLKNKPTEPAAAAEPTLAECIESIAVRQSKDGDKYRVDLLDLYTRRQQPTFAVLVNRRLSEPESKQMTATGQTVNADNVILVQAAGNGANSGNIGGGPSTAPTRPADGINEQFDQISEMNNLNVTLEGLIYDLLGTELLNFNRRVDGPTARSKLAEIMDAQKKVYGEDELASLLRRANIAQYLLLGTGTIVIENSQIKARYNFRLVNQDGQFVAGAPDIVEEVAFKDRSQALRQMAQHAVAKIACELRQEWRRDNLPTVTVKGVADAQDMLNIEKVIKSDAKLFKLVGNPEFVGIGPSTGSCKFSISHKADVSTTQVVEEMKSLTKKLGFELSLESGDFSTYIFVIKRN